MSDAKDETNPAEFLQEMARHQGGVAVVKVKDGHVMYFEKKALVHLLDQCDKTGQDKVIVFIKHNASQA